MAGYGFRIVTDGRGKGYAKRRDSSWRVKTLSPRHTSSRLRDNIPHGKSARIADTDPFLKRKIELLL